MSSRIKCLAAFTAGAFGAALLFSGACTGKNSSSARAESEAAQAVAEETVVEEPVAERTEPSLLERVGRIFTSEPVVKEVPAGTALAVRFVDSLSSETSRVGQDARAEVTRAVTVDGVETIPAGTTVQGQVTVAHPPKIGGRAELAVRFTRLQLPSGDEVPIDAGASWVGKSEKAKDAGTIAGGVVGGAVLGHQVDSKSGKIIGGIFGGAAGTAIAHQTRGKPLIVPAGTAIELQLDSAVRVQVAS